MQICQRKNEITQCWWHCYFDSRASDCQKMRTIMICRTCRGSQQPMRPIWTTRKRFKGSHVLCVDMILACAPGTIKEKHDDFPAQICLVCYRKLCLAYKFRLQCESAYAYFTTCSSDDVKIECIKQEKHDEEQNPISDDINQESNADRSIIQKQHIPQIHVIAGDIEELKLENGVNDNINFANGDDDFDTGSPLDNYEDFSIENNNESDVKEKPESKKTKKRHKSLMKMKKKCLAKITSDVHGKSTKRIRNPLSCTLCPKTFRYKAAFLVHQDSHLGIKRYFCEICQKSYRNEKDHINMHKRGMKFKCELCSKCFNTKAKLAIHKEIHAEERERYPCDVEGCGKFFVSVNGLERHKLVHVGLKNFICQMCSKRFLDKYQLDLHIRIHTNDRRHTCSFCDKKFITTSARNCHEKWHMKMKNYVCQHCEKAFVTSSGLKRHLLCHTKEQPEVCRFCGKKFARFDNRKRHEMAMHYISDKNS